MLQDLSDPSTGVDLKGPEAAKSVVHAPPGEAFSVPGYLKRIYTWCYLHPRMVPLLDRQIVAQAILWGNFGRLTRRALEEFGPGQHVLQPAHAYGLVARQLAERLGPDGHLDLSDIAPIQVERGHRKLAGLGNVTVWRADAAHPPQRDYDGINCFFLLHEVPDSYKRRIVDSLLGALKPGGKAVFIDYHRTRPLHPLRPVMWSVFRFLEPFANSLCSSEIRNFASHAENFEWSKETYFGGLYQKVVARRVGAIES
ncbi:rhodoquinone biosynthesis methyltransferase RquA [Consotaella aegiceratis]|uniref:rhodoquinone biosynthesis methyltransferase RquA n=1 Tax=Consotaella aegiceratis TaxID=3097961 RepID=UPI002F41B8C8